MLTIKCRIFKIIVSDRKVANMSINYKNWESYNNYYRSILFCFYIDSYWL